MASLILWLTILLLSACTGNPSEESPEPTPEEASPSVPDLTVHVQQARAFLNQGRFLQAIEACQAGLALDSTSVELHNMTATAYAAEGSGG